MYYEYQEFIGLQCEKWCCTVDVPIYSGGIKENKIEVATNIKIAQLIAIEHYSGSIEANQHIFRG